IEDGNFIRFRWEDEEQPGAFFEFKISKSEITKDATLLITDNAYNDEENDCIDLWNTQVDSLRRVLGA
ncbi:MAG: START-like domain-containing protein, partial [Bacteroidales bacterium]